jgi:hypothetical protein
MIATICKTLGESIDLEGYADDFDKAIVAVEFSFDQGSSWIRRETVGARPGVPVRWAFSFTPKDVGCYQVKARSVNEDGDKSPQAAVANIIVAAQ